MTRVIVVAATGAVAGGILGLQAAAEESVAGPADAFACPPGILTSSISYTPVEGDPGYATAEIARAEVIRQSRAETAAFIESFEARAGASEAAELRELLGPSTMPAIERTTATANGDVTSFDSSAGETPLMRVIVHQEDGRFHPDLVVRCEYTITKNQARIDALLGNNEVTVQR